MDTEINIKWKVNKKEIEEHITMHKGVYKKLIGKTPRIKKLLQYSSLMAQGNKDCNNFLKMMKKIIDEEYEEFNSFYLRFEKLEVIYIDITMY
jgi:hypothetical protein